MNRRTGATIIVEGTFRTGYERYFDDYSKKVSDFLKKYDTVVVRRQLITERLYGQGQPSLVMLIDFGDKEVAKRIFFEEEYISIIPLRSKVFKAFKMYLAEAGDV